MTTQVVIDDTTLRDLRDGEQSAGVALGLRQFYAMEQVLDFGRLLEASAAVAQASGRPVGWHKSVVGEGVFTHEAGIHLDGLLKDPRNYQHIDPALLGRHHRLLLGKHSGARSVLAAYADLGIDLNPVEAACLLKRIRRFASTTKRTAGPDELRAFRDELSTIRSSIPDPDFGAA
jgi:homocitrate synthase NifV